jgi:hypothetical protein
MPRGNRSVRVRVAGGRRAGSGRVIGLILERREPAPEPVPAEAPAGRGNETAPAAAPIGGDPTRAASSG